MRAAVYLRQSTDRYGDELAVTRQREDCLALCAHRGWTAVEYMDNDTGASDGKPRKAYLRMLDDIKNGKVDAVVAWDADRLHRRPIELEYFIDLADDKALPLATIGGDFDLSTPGGRANARMRGVFARQEMEQKAMRQKRAAKQRAEKDGGGQAWWSTRPFGYDSDPGPDGKWSAKGPIRLNRKEAKLLAQAYHDFNVGSSLRSIASRWNAAGVLTPRGNSWSSTQVRQVLRSARNAGLREYQGKVVGTGDWPAIVSKDVWEMTVRQLDNRTSAKRGRKYLLSGIALCGLCESPVYSAFTNTGRRQYACRACQKISRDGANLDELITEAVVRRLASEDAVELLRPPVDPVDAEALRAERRALEDKLAQLGKDFATAPPEFTQAALAQIDGRLAEIKTALEDPGKAQIFEGVIGAKDVRKAFDNLDLGRQRTIVDTLLVIEVKPVGKRSGPVFNPDAIAVAWKPDFVVGRQTTPRGTGWQGIQRASST